MRAAAHQPGVRPRPRVPSPRRRSAGSWGKADGEDADDDEMIEGQQEEVSDLIDADDDDAHDADQQAFHIQRMAATLLEISVMSKPPVMSEIQISSKVQTASPRHAELCYLCYHAEQRAARDLPLKGSLRRLFWPEDAAPLASASSSSGCAILRGDI
eukprot:3529768-Prymnesium_polylepis.1